MVAKVPWEQSMVIQWGQKFRFIAVFGLGILSVCAVSQAPESLPTLFGNGGLARAIQDGVIVGESYDAKGQPVPTLWQNGIPRALPKPVGWFGTARGIDGRGRIVGTVFSPNSTLRRAVLWSDNGMTMLESGGGFSEANGVSPNGIVVGSIQFSNRTVAAMWQRGQLTLLPSLVESSAVAEAVNDFGVVVGRSVDSSGQMVATYWMRGLAFRIGKAGQKGSAHAIDSRGWIAGTSQSGDARSADMSPTVWPVPERRGDPFSTVPTGDLGAIYSINERSEAVGTNNDIATFWWSREGWTLSMEAPTSRSIAFDSDSFGNVVGAMWSAEKANPTPVRWSPSKTLALMTRPVHVVPGSRASIVAQSKWLSGRPDAGRQFTLDGNSAATTDASGIVRWSLPISGSAKIGGRRFEIRSSYQHVVGWLEVQPATTRVKASPLMIRLGSEVELIAKLENASLRRNLSGFPLRFQVADLEAGWATTDVDGVARLKFRAPDDTDSLGGHPLKVNFPGTEQLRPSRDRVTVTFIP
jgi:hypothetical protein